METFTITENHLKLINQMYVNWNDCETGAPSIDCKRPYGNSYVEGDVCEILDWEPEEKDGDHKLYSEAQEKLALDIHRQTKTVLQICFQELKFETGIFTKENYWSSKWKKVS